MFGIFLSALNATLRFIFTGVAVKFVIFTALFVFMVDFIPHLADLIPGVGGIQGLVNALPDSLMYFIVIFKVPEGITLMISAASTAFIIRRIPFIG